MIKVFSNPTPNNAQHDLTNSINQIVWRMRDLLPEHGVTLVNDHTEAELFVCHAGIGDGHRADVAHISGLYPTYHFPEYEWHYAANAHVIENVRRARVVTVPSQWVAELFARDMHLTTEVIPWGVDADEWQPPDATESPYVLWNKTRVDGICDPLPMNQLAKLAQNMQFVSTFGNPDHNIRITGRLEYEVMKHFVRHAGVYLATTLETFGIGTLEAMACGVPILGYRWGGTADLVQHGVNGYLVEPGDFEGLRAGLDYCLQHRKTLGDNARQFAKLYNWRNTAALLAKTYIQTYERNRTPADPKVSVIIPSYNYGAFVDQAVGSVLMQETTFNYEVIVVDDGSTDNTAEILAQTFDQAIPNLHVHTIPNGGVAEARNYGIRNAKGEYIVCLDADDCLATSHTLQTLADGLDRRPELGIAYGALRIMDAQGTLSDNLSNWPSTHDFEQQIQRHNQVPTMCMFRKEAWARAGGYRKRFTPAEDANLWTWIGAIGYRAEMVTQEPTLLYRLHGGSLSSSVRTGERVEPDWLFDFRWTSNMGVGRPFACDGSPIRGSWLVRNYCLPAVSVVIPCATHHLDYLRDAIDSVESQTYPFWELIVVLDGEIDATKVKELQTRAPFVRWYASNADHVSVGAGAARNIGARRAKGALLVFLDADDMLHPDFLTETLKQHRRTGRYVYTDWRSENKQGVFENNACPEYDPALVFSKTSIHAVTILIDRQVFLSTGGFDENMPAWEDSDFIMKLPTLGYFGVRVPKPLFLYRYRTGQRRETGETIKQELIDLLHRRYADYIEGRKMCLCNPPSGIHMPPGFGFTDSGNSPMETELVRIQYQGGAGDHKVIGAATGTDYRNHQQGDYFFVYSADVEAQPRLFVVEPELPVTSQPTPIPPPPTPIFFDIAAPEQQTP